MKLMLAALAGTMLLGAAISTPAEARCWWNGYRWHCTHYRHYTHHYRHHYWRYGYWYPRYHYRHYRPYYYGYYRPYYYRPVCTPWPLCWG